jgi:small subunit ribosomal protein S20
MPQTKSAQKALKAASRKRVINDRWRKKYRAAVKAVKDAVTADETKKLPELTKEAQSMIDRATRRHILHKNKAARLKASLPKAS